MKNLHCTKCYHWVTVALSKSLEFLGSGVSSMQTTQHLHLSHQLEKWCLKSCEILVYLRSNFGFFANKSTLKLDNCNQNRKEWVVFFQSLVKSSMEVAISPRLARGGWAVLSGYWDREVISRISLVCYLWAVSFKLFFMVLKNTLYLLSGCRNFAGFVSSTKHLGDICMLWYLIAVFRNEISLEMQYILPMVNGKKWPQPLGLQLGKWCYSPNCAYLSVGRTLVPLLAFNFHGNIPRGKNST